MGGWQTQGSGVGLGGPAETHASRVVRPGRRFLNLRGSLLFIGDEFPIVTD